MYLEVKFHDNDFSSYMQESLEDLWDIWQEHDYENGEYIFNPDKTVEYFKRMINLGYLKPYFIRFLILNCLKGDVEHNSRTPRHRDVQYSENKLETLDAVNLSHCYTFEEYFKNIDFELHKNTKFGEKWENSEHLGMDLRTGYIWIF